jgi:hypothetical protein
MAVKCEYSFDCFSCADGLKINLPLFCLAYLLVNLSQLLPLFEISNAILDPQGNNYVVLGL